MICDEVLDQLSVKIDEMDNGRLAIIDKLISLGSWDGYDRNICRLSEISSHITQTYINVNIYRVYDSNNELVHTFENMQLKSILDVETVSSYITTPTGYIFNKWTPEPIEGKWKIEKENFNISALFNLNQYNLYAYSNGGGTATVDKSIVEYGGTATWTATPNTGYKFTSWSDGTTTQKNIKTNITSNISLTANFEAQKYNVTLNTNGGTINSGNITEYTYGTTTTLPTDVTKSDYNFQGWFDNSSLTGTAIISIGPTETEDKTYWAKWTDKYTWVGLAYGTGVDHVRDGMSNQGFSWNNKSGFTRSEYPSNVVTQINNEGYKAKDYTKPNWLMINYDKQGTYNGRYATGWYAAREN